MRYKFAMMWVSSRSFELPHRLLPSLLLGILLLIAMLPCVAAPLYNWTDAEGNTHYSQMAPTDAPALPAVNKRPVLEMVPTSQGDAIYCGPIRLDRYSNEGAAARGNLRAQVVTWAGEARRHERDPKEQRYTAALRCAVAWGEEQLGGRGMMRKESIEEYFTLQRRLDEALARREGCGAGQRGWVGGARAEAIHRCYRESTAEIREVRNHMKKHDYRRGQP